MNKLVLGAFIFLLLTANGYCAYTANKTVQPQTPDVQYQAFVQGTDGTATYKTVFTPGSNGPGSRLYAILETNTDGSATHAITCQLYNGSTGYQIETVNTAVNDGNANGVLNKNLISTSYITGLKQDSNGNYYLDLSSNSSTIVRCAYATALTASTQITLTAIGGDY